MENNDSNATGDAGCGAISQERDSTQCVKVAVHIRPLINSERLLGCSDCITVVPGEPQVQIGNHSFTFDHVYGSTGSPPFFIYDDCVAPLVDALFHGYNATVLAYGQTGSGKTYTMGTGYTGEANNGGIVPKVMATIFERIDALKINTEFFIRVSFIEIFKEEVLDLLDPNLPASMKSDGVHPTKFAVPAKVPIQIRETMNGGITLAGVTEADVQSKEEMASLLAQGSQCRATGSTNMNSQSSFSYCQTYARMPTSGPFPDGDLHGLLENGSNLSNATFIQANHEDCRQDMVAENVDRNIHLNDPFSNDIVGKWQKKIMSCSTAISDEEVGDDILCAKLHLVDLAGSERAKRTGADGMRLKEGIHINRGLLALGNVISALGDDKKRKECAHVPYRDSKLTRLLQDSLGGNSKTVMIACVSPADTNAEETLNTLKYANRARNIQNKAIVNRDPMMAQVQRMRSQIEQLQSELLYSRGEGAPFEELQVLRHKILVLEGSNAELQQELQESRNTCNRLAQQAVDAQVEKDKLIVKVELARSGKPWDEIDSSDRVQNFDLVKGYVTKIQELEGELQRQKIADSSNCGGFIDCLVLEDVELGPKSLHDFPTVCGSNTLLISEDVEKELEHTSIQDRLDQELQELDKRLEQKEAEMKRVAKFDTSVLKQHYEKKLLELEQEKTALQKEIEGLRTNLAAISSTSDDGAQKLREDYLQKLNILEAQVAELKKKQEAQSQLLRQKQKSDEAAKRLHKEIQRIKTQKVQLQHKIKQESEQFRSWRASREKEVLQLKKEGRRNEFEMHKLLALNQRQKMVLQRKTEEASMATKRLKELLEARKASSRETFGGGNGNGPGFQGNEKALLGAIEHELEVMVRVHEVRSEYERQIEVRAAMAKELAKLKDEFEMSKQNSASGCHSTMSPGARNSRILALENMLATSSSTLVSMASHLSEAECERVFSGKGRWNQVRSLPYAKNLMNYLFNIASSSRCQLRNKELECREANSKVRELKDKIIKLTTVLKQMEIKKHEGEIRRQEKKAASRKRILENSVIFGADSSNTGEDGLPYYLRKGPRSSQIAGINFMDLSEDMDTSESDQSDQSDNDWAIDGSGRRLAQKRGSSMGLQTVESYSPEEPQNSAAPRSESCCSCGRSSQCKTKKCECRAIGGTCGMHCGCRPGLCSNQEGSVVKNEQEGLTDLKVMEVDGNGPLATEPEGTNNNVSLASQGAALLQSALAERSAELDTGSVQQRKPLNDIGNTMGNSTLQKGNKKKKWRKSVIQLVPVAPPSGQLENSEATEPTGNPIKPDIPLRLPRAMRSTVGNSTNPLRERNSGLTEESRGEKDAGNVGARSPLQPARDSSEKENNRM